MEKRDLSTLTYGLTEENTQLFFYLEAQNVYFNVIFAKPIN